MNTHSSPVITARLLETGRTPGALRRWLSAHYALALFFGLCLLPTLLAAVYFGLVASDRYVSEVRFVVRSASKPATDGAAAYLQDFGISRASDDAFAVQDYIRSRDAMHAIMRKIDLRKIWRPEGADALSRYGCIFCTDTDETLFRHYLSQIKVEKNLETGITTVRVTAYEPRDSYIMAQEVLQLSELKVNAMNTRARADRLEVAQREADAAARTLAQANIELTRYRNEARLIDPEQSAQATTQQQSALESERAQVVADLQGMTERAPNNPAIPALTRRLAGLDAQIGERAGRLTGSNNALSGAIGGYEKQLVERELAGKMYEAAQKRLDNAVDEANRQQVFLEAVTAPNLPDAATEPRRLRYTGTVALLSFWTFLSFYLLLSGSREHLNLS